MLEVLRCLKNTGSKTRTIQSKFSQHEYSASLEIETNVFSLYLSHHIEMVARRKPNPFLLCIMLTVSCLRV